jgi:hypothetical protein
MAACPHSAPGRQHQNGLGRLQPCAREQHLPGRQKRQRKGGRVDVGDVIRNRNEIRRRHGDVFGIPAVRLVTQDIVGGAEVVFAGQAPRASARS